MDAPSPLVACSILTYCPWRVRGHLLSLNKGWASLRATPQLWRTLCELLQQDFVYSPPVTLS